MRNPMPAKCFKSTEIISLVKSRLIPNIKYNKLIFLFVFRKELEKLILLLLEKSKFKSRENDKNPGKWDITIN